MNAPISFRRLDVSLLESHLNKAQGRSEGFDEQLGHNTATVYIGVGGSGAAILRRIKFASEQFGISASKTEFLVLDTDGTSQNGEGSFPGFSSEQFCFLNIEAVDDVLKFPEAHPFIAERLALTDNPQLLTQLRDIRAKGGTQAGQVAALGLLAYLANFPVVQAAIDDVVQRAFGQFSDLDGEQSAQRAPRIVIISSVAGGTGRGFFLELAVYLRHLLGNNVIVDVHLVCPNAFRDAFKNRNQQLRADANGAAALTAIDAFSNGYGLDIFKMGASEADAVTVPENIFNKLFVYERVDLNRRDSQSRSALFDRIAMHIATDLKTSIGSYFDSVDNNFASELPVDPASGKPRRYSTNNAVLLGVDPTSMMKFGAARQIVDLLNAATGSTSDVSIQAQAKDTCNKIAPAGAVAKQLHSTLPVDAKAASRNLVSAGAIEAKPKHHSAAVLKQRVQMELQALGKSRTNMQKRLGETAKRRKADSAMALQNATAAIVDSAGGLKSAKQFLETVGKLLGSELTTQQERLNAAQKQEAECRSRLNSSCNRLGWLSGNTVKTDVVLAFRDCFDKAMEVDCHAAAADHLEELVSLCNRIATQLEQSLAAVQNLREEAGKILVANTPDDRLFGPLQCQLNLATPEMYGEFYDSHRLNVADVFNEAARELTCSAAEVKARMVSEAVFDKLVSRVVGHFAHATNQFNVAEWLDGVLRERTELSVTVARKIQSGFENCAPSFRARTGNAMVRFTDTMLVGLPGNIAQYPRLQTVLERAKARVARNSPVAIQIVPSNLRHSLVILRRTHGACLHYLSCWDEMAASYEAWKRQGSHPVETFNQKILASFAPVKPDRIANRNEFATAIGLSMGFIAKVGSQYYRNLTATGTNGQALFRVELASDWDGLSFESGQVNLASPINALRSGNRIEFAASRIGNEKLLLTDDLGSLSAVVASDFEFVSRIEKAFETLRQVAGDHAVVVAIDQYCSTLQRKFRQGDAGFEIAQRHMHVLQQLIAQIRGAA